MDGPLLQDSQGHYYTKLGSLLRVLIRIETPVQRYHVAMVDECPSGCEPLLIESPSPQEDPWRWYEQHIRVGYVAKYTLLRRFRVSKVEAYTSVLPPGCHFYSYLARVTNVGTFYGNVKLCRFPNSSSSCYKNRRDVSPR
jgi:hypothetical protein